jgi:hypothetical protein
MGEIGLQDANAQFCLSDDCCTLQFSAVHTHSNPVATDQLLDLSFYSLCCGKAGYLAVVKFQLAYTSCGCFSSGGVLSETHATCNTVLGFLR